VGSENCAVTICVGLFVRHLHHWIAVQKLIGLDCIAAPMSLSCYFELALHTDFAMNVHSKKELQHHQKKVITGDDIKAPQKRDMNRKSFVYRNKT